MRTKFPCSRCESLIDPRNTTGLCLRCFNSDPQRIRARAVNISATRRRMLASDPEFAARQREHGLWLARNYAVKANASISPETRARVGRKYTERRLGWCPVERRDEYRRMVTNRGFTAAEARAVIEASMTSFERQMAKVRAGAGIVEIRPPAPAEPAYSLTGSSMATAVYG